MSILLPAVAVGAWLLLSTKAKAQRFTKQARFTFAGVSLGTISLLTTNIVLKFNIDNPSSTTLKVQGLSGELIYKGNTIGSFSNVIPLVIPKNSTLNVSTLIRINHLSAGGEVINIIRNLFSKNREIPELKSLTIKGTINLGITLVPFEFSA